ncbi:MAG TPA: squalene--hopene cyclase [Candidatus Dormibacteraeota bacterium]|nr:squalene--hopene cyclase [Candidatus Dormibacteraeota bacterium]
MPPDALMSPQTGSASAVPGAPDADGAALRAALDASVAWLLERQSPAGWWTAELESNCTMTAEHVLLLRFLGLPLDGIRERAVAHLEAERRDDGSWALYHDGPADVSTTIECYAALKVLGVDAASATMRRSLRVIHEQGGLADARVFTKIWLALFGEHPWKGVPSMPPELIAFPRWAPLNLYNFASWARGTIAPLLVVLSRRPVRPLGVSLGEIVVPGTEHRLRRVPGSGPFWWLDQVAKAYERLPRQPLRAAARRHVLEWIVSRQEADGSWGGIQPPWVYSLIALHLEGYPLDHPVMQAGIHGLDTFALDDARSGWRLQACMSPVWDTALTVLSLRAAGVPAGHDSIRRAARWLLDEQVPDRLGDWAVRVRGARECGGWAFEFANDTYPDVDDTAVAVLALLRCERTPEVTRAVEHGLRWVLAMRSSDGAWGAFDRDNTHELAYKLPFADFGALLDPPSEDVTAHAVEMLAAMGRTAADPVVARAVTRLRAWQRPDGSWFGRWGVNHVYGTWCVIAALSALGTGADAVRAGVDWLEAHQNADGGWGETCHSYEDVSFAGVGRSTPSQTAWAVVALQLAGAARSDAARRGLDHLVRTQSGGTWSQDLFTGTGFPRDFYIDYHHYRHVFPVLALGQAVHGVHP